MYMKGHGLAGSYFNLKHKCLILPSIKCSPPPKTVFFHWFIFCLFNKYFMGYSSLTSSVSKYWCFIRKVSLQKDFFSEVRKTHGFRDIMNVLSNVLNFFLLWWKTSWCYWIVSALHFFFEKKIYHHHVSFVVLGFYKPWHVIFPLLLPCQNIDILSGTLFIYLFITENIFQ